MAPQTRLDYNELMFAVHDIDYKYKDGIVVAGADLVEGQVVVLDTGKYRAAIDADKGVVISGWRILLADAAAAGGDVPNIPMGISGGINTDKIVGAGLAVDDELLNILEVNRIIVQGGTNAIQVAGEDA
jgi:hypothetical protein